MCVAINLTKELIKTQINNQQFFPKINNRFNNDNNNKNILLHVNKCEFNKKKIHLKKSICYFQLKKLNFNLCLKINKYLNSVLNFKKNYSITINNKKDFFLSLELMHKIIKLINLNFFFKTFSKVNQKLKYRKYVNNFLENWYQTYILFFFILYMVQFPSKIKANELSSFRYYSTPKALFTNTFKPIFLFNKFSYLLSKNNKLTTKKLSSNYFSPDSLSYLLQYTTRSTNYLYNQNTSALDRSNAFLLNYTPNILNNQYVKFTSLYKKTSLITVIPTKTTFLNNKIPNHLFNVKLNLPKSKFINDKIFSQSISKNKFTFTNSHQYFFNQKPKFNKNNTFIKKNFLPEKAFLVLNNQFNLSSLIANNNSQNNLNKVILFNSTYKNINFFYSLTNLTWWTHVPYPKSGYSKLSIVFLAFFITIIMILIVVGNLLVCIAICTEKSLKTIQNWFIASLAVSDLLLGLVIMPFSLAYELMGYWIFGGFWCEMHHALDVLLTTASINNLCLISLDRYWSVTQAIEYLKKRTPCRAIFMIAFAWVFSAAVCLPPLVGWKKENQKLNECELNDDFGYVLYSSLGSFYIPAVVMVFVYAKIFLAARSRARKHVRKKQSAINVSNEKNIQNRQQTYFELSQNQMINNYNSKNISKIQLIQTESNLSEQKLSYISKVNNQQPTQFLNHFNESNVLKNDKSKFRVLFGRFACKTHTGIGLDLEFEHINTQNEKNDINKIQIDSKTEKNYKINCDKTNLPLNKLEKNIQNKNLNKNELISKIQFLPKEIVFDYTKNNSFQALLPKIVIHGSMQKLNLHNENRRFSSSILCSTNENDLNINSSLNHFKNKNFKITNTLSVGHLNCEFFDTNYVKSINKNKQNKSKLLNVIFDDKKNEKKTGNEYNKEEKINLISSENSLYHNNIEISSPNSFLIINESKKIEQEKYFIPSNNKENNLNVLNEINLNKNPGLIIKKITSNKNKNNQNQKKLNDQENKNYLEINSPKYVESLSNSISSINCDNNLIYLEKKNFKKEFENSSDLYEYDIYEENESSFANEIYKNHKMFKKKKCSNLFKWFVCRKWTTTINENFLNNQEEYNDYEEEDEEDDLEYSEYIEETKVNYENLDQSRKKLSLKNKNFNLKKKIYEKRKPISSITNNNTSSCEKYSGSFCQISFTPNNKRKYKNNNLFNRFRSNKNSNKSNSSSSRKCTTSGFSSHEKSKDKIFIKPISAISSSLNSNNSKNNLKNQKIECFQTSQSNTKTKYRSQANEADYYKRKLAKAREKRATFILGLIMGSFIAGWIPFFGLYLLQGICAQCKVQSALAFGYWLGYCNSAINPIIYTVFNRDFRKAFRKILFR